jgi:hypothetical protein
MLSGIEHTALTLHIGYTIESFLIHIEILPSACDDKRIPIRISGSSSMHVFLVLNEQLEPFLIRKKLSLCHVTATDQFDSGIMCLARSILLLATKRPIILAIQSRKIQMFILYLIVELSLMENKIEDVPFRTRHRITAATIPLAFHCQ